jgi:probable O-glycosylation ligase (exosortase A-associated)
MRDLLLALIIFGSVPFTLVRPFVGVLLFTWFSLMNPHRMTYGFALSLRSALVIGATTVVAWLVSREPKRPPLTAPVIFLILFTFWVSFCTLFAINADAALKKWDQVIKILGMSLVCMCMLRGRERIELMVWTIAISLGFYGFRGGVFTILTGGNYRVWGPPDTFIEDNNQLALALIMVLPLMWYLYITAKPRWVRLGVLAVAGCTLIAVMGTYSRGGALALFVMLGFLWLKSPYKIVTLVLGVVLVGVVLMSLPDQWFARMGSISNYENDPSAQARIWSWTFAWRMALDRPFTGGGFSVFYVADLYKRLVPESSTFYNAHSIYFEMLGESGFVGLGLFLLLGLSSLLTAGSILRRTKGRPDLTWARNLAAMAQVSLIGYASAGAFLNLGFFDLYYAIVAVIVGLDATVKEELAKSAETQPRVRRPTPPVSKPADLAPARTS